MATPTCGHGLNYLTLSFTIFFLLLTTDTFSQNVGIGINTPKARLHVADSSVVFTGPATLPVPAANPPVSGDGTRFMWYADKAALRAGHITTGWNHWDNSNIGEYSLAIGRNVKASGHASIVLGDRSSATANNTVAIGDQVNATGYNSIVIGTLSTASGIYSTAIGLSVTTKARSGFTIGNWNNIDDNPNPTSENANDRLFQIGNGNFYTRSNAVTILRNGNLGIGTTTPGFLLNFADALGDKIALYGNTGPHYGFGIQSGLLQIHTDLSTSHIAFGYGTSTAFTENMRIQGNGNLLVRGSVTANSSFYTSDSRFKTNIQLIGNALDKIKQLNGYHYQWADEKQDKSLQSGVLAQEVQKLFPELVKADEKGYLSVNYVGLIPYMIQSIKEQEVKLRKQDEEKKNQDEKIDALEKKIEELRKMLEK